MRCCFVDFRYTFSPHLFDVADWGWGFGGCKSFRAEVVMVNHDVCVHEEYIVVKSGVACSCCMFVFI